MAALRAAYNLTVAEGWRSYRTLRALLDRPLGLVDLVKHPKYTGQAARYAKQETVRSLSRAIAATPPFVPPLTPAQEIEYDDIVEFEFSAETEGGT